VPLSLTIIAERPPSATIRSTSRPKRRRAQLKDELTGAKAPAPRLHPNLAEFYRERIAELARVLSAEDRAEAREMVRGLVEAIRLIPEGDRLRIEVRGELGAILRLADGDRNAKGADRVVSTLVEQIKVDTGTRNRRYQYIDVTI